MDTIKIDFYLNSEIEKWKSFPIAQKYQNNFDNIQKHLISNNSNPYYSGGGNYASSRSFIPFKLAAVSGYNLLFLNNSFCSPFVLNEKSIEELGGKYDLRKTLLVYQPFYTGDIDIEDLVSKVETLKSFQIPCYFIDFDEYIHDHQRAKKILEILPRSIYVEDEVYDKAYCIALFDFFFHDKLDIELDEEQKVIIGQSGSKCLHEIIANLNFSDKLMKDEWFTRITQTMKYDFIWSLD